jgi:hypothetical protein
VKYVSLLDFCALGIKFQLLKQSISEKASKGNGKSVILDPFTRTERTFTLINAFYFVTYLRVYLKIMIWQGTKK